MSELADLPLLTAEFLAVDTETNGLAREACELTEVGAVLVGGGELHERWSSIVGVDQPLSRGIQRFTGISQAMVDAAPPARRCLPQFAEQLRGRVLVARSGARRPRAPPPPPPPGARGAGGGGGGRRGGGEGGARPPPVVCTVA